MSKEGDIMPLCNDVLEPLKPLINTESPEDKLSSATKQFVSAASILPLKNVGGKSKSSIWMDDVCRPMKRARAESGSTPASPMSAPCEIKKLKIDLIAAKAQLTKLESSLNHQHTIFMEKQILFEEEKGLLMDQHKRGQRALSDMEDRLQLIGRREQEWKDDYYQVIKEIKANKIMWDQQKGELQKQIADMRDKLFECTASSKDQLSKIKKDMDELLQALECAQSEVEILKIEVAKQTRKAGQCTTLRTQLEKKTFELQSVTNKLKKLEYEYERDCCKDMDKWVRKPD